MTRPVLQQTFLTRLLPEDRELIYKTLEQLSGRSSEDLHGSIGLVFNDMLTFSAAVQESIFAKLENLPKETADLVVKKAEELVDNQDLNYDMQVPASLADAIVLLTS